MFHHGHGYEVDFKTRVRGYEEDFKTQDPGNSKSRLHTGIRYSRTYFLLSTVEALAAADRICSREEGGGGGEQRRENQILGSM